jgi:thiaminase/transcriptional activator TenA
MRADALFAASRDLAEACLAHPFVRGIADGSAPRARFAGYLAQDAFFLAAFARAYAAALARTSEDAGLWTFKRLLDGVARELELHRGYAARWGIDLAAVEPLPATLAYTEFLAACAGRDAPPQIAAAMAPCMRLYAWLGQRLAPGADPAGPYHEWVRTYADPAIAALAGELEALLDGPGADPAVQARHYRRAMQLEYAFFDAHR